MTLGFLFIQASRLILTSQIVLRLFPLGLSVPYTVTPALSLHATCNLDRNVHTPWNKCRHPSIDRKLTFIMCCRANRFLPSRPNMQTLVNIVTAKPSLAIESVYMCIVWFAGLSIVRLRWLYLYLRLSWLSVELAFGSSAAWEVLLTRREFETDCQEARNWQRIKELSKQWKRIFLHDVRLTSRMSRYQVCTSSRNSLMVEM